MQERGEPRKLFRVGKECGDAPAKRPRRARTARPAPGTPVAPSPPVEADTMHRLRERDGWTMIEVLTIIAIVGVMSTMAVASLRSYSRREDTRRAARAVAGILESARSRGAHLGPDDVGGVQGAGERRRTVRGRAVRGADPRQRQRPAADCGRRSHADQTCPRDRSQHCRLYEAGTSPYGSVVLPAEDYSNDVVDGSLANTVDGTTLNVDVVLQAPTIGFSSQGFPVRAANPLQPGTGAGTIYLTDNESSVVAVTVLPAGSVHTLAYDSASGSVEVAMLKKFRAGAAHRESGFTLIEVMIAMTILSVGLMSIAVAQLTAIKVSSRSKHMQDAMFLAREQMDTLIGDRPDHQPLLHGPADDRRPRADPGRQRPGRRHALHAAHSDLPESAPGESRPRGRHGDLDHREYAGKPADSAHLCDADELAMKTNTHSQAGFSLLELMIAVAIMGVVTAQIFIVMGNQKKVYSSNERAVDTQETARMTLDLVSFDARVGGYMVPSWTAVSSVDGGADKPDRFCVSSVFADPGVCGSDPPNPMEQIIQRFDGAAVSEIQGDHVKVASLDLNPPIDGTLGTDDFTIGDGVIVASRTETFCARISNVVKNGPGDNDIFFETNDATAYLTGLAGGELQAVPANVYELKDPLAAAAERNAPRFADRGLPGRVLGRRRGRPQQHRRRGHRVPGERPEEPRSARRRSGGGQRSISAACA